MLFTLREATSHKPNGFAAMTHLSRQTVNEGYFPVPYRLPLRAIQLDIARFRRDGLLAADHLAGAVDPVAVAKDQTV